MLTVFVFSAVYLAVAIGFPNPSVPGRAQFAWRLAAWVACLIAFAIHFAIEHFRFHRRPVAVARHVGGAVALGAFGLAIAASVHRARNGMGNHSLLTLALVVWPILAGGMAFLVAWGGAAVLDRQRE